MELVIKQYILSNSCTVEKPDNNGKVNDNNDINDKEILTNGHVVVEMSSEDHMTLLRCNDTQCHLRTVICLSEVRVKINKATGKMLC